MMCIIYDIRRKCLLSGDKSNMDINFEWDEEKARINIKKHGISFEIAAKVF